MHFFRIHGTRTPLFHRALTLGSSHTYRAVLQDGKLPFDLAVKSGCSVELLALLQPDSIAWLDGGEGFQQPDRPLVSAAESRVFGSLAHLLDPNPRRLKRIISVYALVTEVAKRVPLSEGSLEASLPVQMRRWPEPNSPAEGLSQHTRTAD
jgi:hypothetical protein